MIGAQRVPWFLQRTLFLLDRGARQEELGGRGLTQTSASDTFLPRLMHVVGCHCCIFLTRSSTGPARGLAAAAWSDESAGPVVDFVGAPAVVEPVCEAACFSALAAAVDGPLVPILQGLPKRLLSSKVVWLQRLTEVSPTRKIRCDPIFVMRRLPSVHVAVTPCGGRARSSEYGDCVHIEDRSRRANPRRGGPPRFPIFGGGGGGGCRLCIPAHSKIRHVARLYLITVNFEMWEGCSPLDAASRALPPLHASFHGRSVTVTIC